VVQFWKYLLQSRVFLFYEWAQSIPSRLIQCRVDVKKLFTEIFITVIKWRDSALHLNLGFLWLEAQCWTLLPKLRKVHRQRRILTMVTPLQMLIFQPAQIHTDFENETKFSHEALSRFYTRKTDTWALDGWWVWGDTDVATLKIMVHLMICVFAWSSLRQTVSKRPILQMRT